MSFILQRRMAAAKKDTYIPLPKAFSIAKNKQVLFSQGNLQYQASSDTWRFAQNQWEYVGDNTDGNVYENNIKCSNNLISDSYSGWIDLFGWGTSGYHDSNDPYNVNYQPWSTSSSTVNANYNKYGYGPSNNMLSPNLTETSANYDWGVCNAISNGGNQAGMWRTLTSDEWQYVLKDRQTQSGVLFVFANVNNVDGLILLPDDWNENYYTFTSPNTYGAHYSYNIITLEQWNVLENHGAIFLPVTGWRDGTNVANLSLAWYWSASQLNASMSQYVDLYTKPLSYIMRNRGLGVRLVKDVVAKKITVKYDQTLGSVTGGGVYANGDQCTLVATPKSGYSFVKWTENGQDLSTSDTLTFIVSTNRKIKAVFG